MLEESLLEEIIAASRFLHGAGRCAPLALRAMARLLGARPIPRSAETGAGATTLLFSHISEHHTVFSLDEGGSLSAVKRSLLLKPETVTFVEGPTQKALPSHHFEGQLQAVLLDGPHAYPFPQLEYYFLYPHLGPDALLIIDDIHIPSVHELYRFLRADAMFELVEVVGRTAFFRRTAAPVFDPFGDAWWKQGLNRKQLLRYVWRDRVKEAIPSHWRSAAKSLLLRRGAIRILAPVEREVVGGSGVVRGTANLPPNTHLWLFARRQDQAGWWPQGGAPVQVEDGRFSHPCRFGEPSDVGTDFEIALVAVDERGNKCLKRWVKEGRRSGAWPPIPLPKARFCAPARVTVRKDRHP